MSALLRYRYADRGREIHAEVICRRHYELYARPGGFMGPLTDAEKRRGKSQAVTPYTGDEPCGLCAEEAEHSTEAVAG